MALIFSHQFKLITFFKLNPQRIYSIKIVTRTLVAVKWIRGWWAKEIMTYCRWHSMLTTVGNTSKLTVPNYTVGCLERRYGYVDFVVSARGCTRPKSR